MAVRSLAGYNKFPPRRATAPKPKATRLTFVQYERLVVDFGLDGERVMGWTASRAQQEISKLEAQPRVTNLDPPLSA